MTRLHLAAEGAFDHRSAVATLQDHAIEGLERHGPGPAAGRHLRLVTIGGEFHPVELRADAGGLTVDIDSRDEGVVAGVGRLVTSWFDLDTDIGPVDRHLTSCPVLGPGVVDRPGMRITGYPDGFEAVVLTVLGQQVTLAAARRFGARLVAAFGSDGPGGLRAFPTPGRLAAVDLDRLRSTVGLTGARARTVAAVAALFADGYTLPGPAADVPGPGRPGDAGSLGELGAVPGIGPWTLSYLSIRACGHPDTLPASDAVLRRALAAAGGEEPVEAQRRWVPWRSYATVRLWAGAAGR